MKYWYSSAGMMARPPCLGPTPCRIARSQSATVQPATGLPGPPVRFGVTMYPSALSSMNTLPPRSAVWQSTHLPIAVATCCPRASDALSVGSVSDRVATS